jgi:serine/threonine-protein kinase RsbW
MQADFVLELPNDLRVIDRAVDYLVARCCEVGFDCDRMGLKLRVGVTEALANAMLYGNGRDPRKRVLVEARMSVDAIVVRVTDEGRGFDPDALPDPTLPAHRTRPGGRGIFLIRELMDRVEFNEQGNSITMILHGEPSSVEG